MKVPQSHGLLLSSILPLLGGCPSEDTDPPETPDTDPGLITTGGEPNAGDGLDEESGAPPPGLPNACLIGPEVGLFGYVHQCGGFFGVQIGDDVGLLFEEPGFFGEGSEGDSYSEPKVMACCDVYDVEGPQPHETACYKDLVETLCLSASAKVAVAFDGVVGGDNLAVHVASEEGQEACKLAFNSEIDSWADPLDPEDPLDLTWAIGNNLVQWPAIDEPFFHIDAQVTDVFIPVDSDDYIVCEDNNYNNGQSLIGLGDSPEYALMLSEGDGVLVGPTYNTSPMSGNVVFSSGDTSCLAPLCSRLHFSENVSDWTVHNLALYSSAGTTVSDNVESFDVDWYHIEMVGAVSATEKATNKFEIAAGEAIFQLSGNVEGMPHHLTVTNASTITVQKIFGVWRTSSFALQYIDSANSTWTLAIAGAGWEIP